MNLEKKYDEVYAALRDGALDLFEKKLPAGVLRHYSLKLQEQDPRAIKEALCKTREKKGFFPTLEEIFEAIRESRRGIEKKAIPCSKCGGDGAVVLFNKKTYERSTFSCDCKNGENFYTTLLNKYGIRIIPRISSGPNWVERAQFIDNRLKLTPEERSKRLDEYWAQVFGLRSAEAPKENHLRVCNDPLTEF